MFADVPADPPPMHASSPRKGKERQHEAVDIGWWDLHPLAERAQRALAWSSIDTIFAAHPHQPAVVRRFFPPTSASSTQSPLLPSHGPILSSPAAYEPPSVIVVKPTADVLFAYFPGRSGDGLGCLWYRRPRLQSADWWEPGPSWDIPRGSGVVTATWLAPPREWCMTPEGVPTRLPPRGPFVPSTYPILMMVTQNQHIEACILRHTHGPTRADPTMIVLKHVACPLTMPHTSQETDPNSHRDQLSLDDSGGTDVCVAAAIGMPYDDSSLLVALRSHLHPPPPLVCPPQTGDSETLPIDLTISLDDHSGPLEDGSEWEIYGERDMIDMCEVRIGFDGNAISMTTLPCPPVSANGHVAQLEFVSVPKLPGAKTNEEPTTSPGLFMVANVLNLGDYTSTPKSQLMTWSITRHSPSNYFARLPNVRSPWHILSQRGHLNRILDEGTFAFIAPYLPSTAVSKPNLIAGLVNTHIDMTSAPPPRRKGEARTMEVGKITVLRLPDLVEDDCDATPLLCSADDIGRDVPFQAVMSPGKVFLSAATLASASSVRTAIHPIPSYRLQSGPSESQRYTIELLAAIYSRRTASDVVHALAQPSLSLPLLEDFFDDVLRILENRHLGHLNQWITDASGIACQVYGARSQVAKAEDIRRDLDARFSTLRNICSLVACQSAFEQCQEGNVYDVDAVWQLIGVTTWFLDLLEKLARECVLQANGSDDISSGSKDNEQQDDVEDDLFGSAPGTPSSGVKAASAKTSHSAIFLLISHPFALNHIHGLLGHVIGLREHLQACSPSGETAQIAKDILLDLIECSGLNLTAFKSAFNDMEKDVGQLPAPIVRKALAMGRPGPGLGLFLLQASQKIASPELVDKPRLFIKPNDLLDGISQLSTFDPMVRGTSEKEKTLDIVTKMPLVRPNFAYACLRCDGRSQIGLLPHISRKWASWERNWATRCICGGSWIHSSV